MNVVPAESEPEVAASPPVAGWSRQRWLFWITFALAVHVALIWIFGTKKQITPRAVSHVPQFHLADPAGELVALGNPTLFALPNAHDFATAIWLKKPDVPVNSFRYAEPPGWLPPTTDNLGASFREFMRTNISAALPLNFKPEPPLTEPVATSESVLPTNSTLHITGELAHRRRLNQIALPSLPRNDVIAPSQVQVLVDPAGQVSSAILLPSGNPLDHDDAADQHALALARTLRFAPAPELMFGELIFHWHTVPVTTPNAP